MSSRRTRKSDGRLTGRKLPVSAVQRVADEFVDDGSVSHVDPAIIADAGRMLGAGGFRDFLLTSDVEIRLQWLSNHVAFRQKISRKQHYEQFAQGYALFALSREDCLIGEAVKQLARDRKRVIDGRTSELRLYVEAFISYGTEEDNARGANRAFSRDVAAIKTLLQRGVLPSEVMNLASKPGEGLDVWARASAKPREGEQQPGVDTPSAVEGTPAENPGQSRSNRSRPALHQKEERATGLKLPPSPQKFIWTFRLRNGEHTMRELEFMRSRETDDILMRCFDDLRALQAIQSRQAPRRSVAKLKPATSNIDPKAIRAASRKKSAN